MPRSADFPQDATDKKPDVIDEDIGMPRYNRRLSDKVLAAFNHAYAVGEIEVAASLREILARLDNNQESGEAAQRRDGAIALSQADM